MNTVLVICGPTATGKTNLGLKLAKQFNGQIISADSRQVYQGMDIGTGKDLPTNAKQHPDGHYLIKGIKVWGYDLVKPDQEFSVGHFVKFALPRIKAIWQAGDLPILVGGTGLYLKAILKPFDTISIPVNQSLRDQLNSLTVKDLKLKLKKTNPTKFDSMNHSDQSNPRRLIRAIEVASSNLQDLQGVSLQVSERTVLSDTNKFWIGLKADKKILEDRIIARVNQRLKAGSQSEIKTLIKAGYSFNLPSMSAMGYHHWQSFFNNQETIDQVKKAWILSEKQYLRRQLTWFNKKKNINWFDITDKHYPKAVVTKLKTWYTIH